MLEDSSDIFLPYIRNTLEDHLLTLKKHSWVRNTFTVNVNEVGEDIPGFQEELIDLQEDQVQKQRFENF